MNLEDTLKEVLNLVEPTRDEEKKVREIVDEVKLKVEECSRDEKAVRTVEVGGSYAKGTWLKDDVDIDIFVKFSPDISKKRLEELGVKIGKKTLANYPHALRYSEHPYVEGFIDRIRVNIVACYDVEAGRWQSAADRSPYHTQLIKSRFNNQSKTEARLLKRFLKGVGLYGAEIKTQGLSGYVCEVLILKFGSFKSVLKAASSFKEGEVISIEDVDEEAVTKFRTPIIILDPVDKRRNLGAAISSANAASFTLASRNFLQSPNLTFFKGMPTKDRYIQIEKSPLLDNLMLVLFQHKPRTVDILWGQLKRSEHHLVKQLSKAGFQVLRSSSASDEDSTSGFIFLLDSQILPKSQVKIGPKVDMADDTSKFLNRNRKQSMLIWVSRDLRLYALGERRRWRADELLRDLLSGVVEGSGVAPGLKSDIKSGFEIFSGEDILKVVDDKKWLIEALSQVVVTDKFSFGSS